MDLTAAYCQTRRDLEEQSWRLTSDLAVFTARLVQLVGHEHDDFLAMLDHCRTAELDFAQSCDDLRDHRRAHGC
jgi:hypothetical protein